MKEHRDHQRPGDEQHLAAYEDGQVPAFGPGDAMLPNSTGRHVGEVVVEMPLDGQQSVQNPEIKPLSAMKPISMLFWRESSEDADVDVIVLPGNVRISVVNGVMLPIPHIRAAS